MVRKQQILYAVIMIIAASSSFSCETRETVLQAGYNVQPEQKYDSRRKQNDAAFIIETFNDLMLEYQLSGLAVKKASSADVKEFAISVLTDHSIALDELREMSTRMNVPLPDELSGAHKKHYVSIAKRVGPRFDKSFCDFIYLSNSVALKKFEKIVQDGNSEEVKDWAWGKVGILKRHIAMAQNTGGSGAGVSTVGQSMIE